MPVDVDQNRLVAKEVALGQVREIQTDDAFIGGTLAPLESVESDDVIFSYIIPDVDGMAPARAEDAEAEMAQKDDTFGTGRASIIDWAIKDRYATSDVTRYRDFLDAANMSPGAVSLTITRMIEGFDKKVARDTALRRKKLDNRLEWLATQGVWNNSIAYNDGNIVFTVPFGRPADQQAQAPANGVWSVANHATMDPIGDLIAASDFMYNRYGMRPDHGYTSLKVLRSIINSDRFAARSGLAIPQITGTGGTPVDPKYLIDGWNWQAAAAVVQAQSGITLLPYDAVYRTRTLTTKTTVVNRFTDERDIVLLPPSSIISEISELGFGKMLTSPHPAGNFTSGFYEWERDTIDPWSHDMGTGIKAFPVFPHLEFSYHMRALT
jgi:hypothetical protein